jgi:CubicO group peptidase (beta-lactamase class C family)
VSKVFPVIQALLLAEAGKISMDDEVRKYIPELTLQNPWPNSARSFTFRDLASQMGGLPREVPCSHGADFTPSDCTTVTDAVMWSRIQKLTMVRPPSTIGIYSNLGFGIFGNVLSNITNTPYPTMLQKNIFDPLGFNSTSATMSTIDLSRTAVGYLDSPNGPVACTSADGCLADSGWSAGSGGVYSTVNDLAKLVSFYFRDNQRADPKTGQILDGQTIRESILPRSWMRDGLSGFAMPWEMYTLNDYVIRVKDGEVAGYSTQVMMVHELKLGVIVLANQFGHSPSIGQEIIGTLLPAFDSVFRYSSNPWPLPPNPTMFLGTYSDSRGSVVVSQQLPGAPLIIELGPGYNFGLRWMGAELPSQPYTFQTYTTPGDLNSCMNIQTGDEYQFAFFQLNSGNTSVVSLTMDIYYQRVWVKQALDSPALNSRRATSSIRRKPNRI